jgi:hypothetical protein
MLVPTRHVPHYRQEATGEWSVRLPLPFWFRSPPPTALLTEQRSMERTQTTDRLGCLHLLAATHLCASQLATLIWHAEVMLEMIWEALSSTSQWAMHMRACMCWSRVACCAQHLKGTQESTCAGHGGHAQCLYSDAIAVGGPNCMCRGP